MQVCSVVAENTEPSASGIIQNLAPAVFSIHNASMSRER
jgi:hypothetical protein